MFNVDGTQNEAGSITEVIDAILRFKDHMEQTTFAVTSLGSQALILRYTWPEEHSPEINWQTCKVKMSCCPMKCQTCCKEETTKHCKVTAKAHAATEWICEIRTGPFPALAPEGEPEEEFNLGDQENRMVLKMTLLSKKGIVAST